MQEQEQEQAVFDGNLYATDERSQRFMSVTVSTQSITNGILLDQKKKIQMIQRFSKRYGLSSLSHRSEDQPPINYSANKRDVRSIPPSCLLDCLPQDILRDILSRLSIRDLFMARQSCVAWHRIVSFCPIFRELYDERNQQSWITLTSTSRDNPDGFVLFSTNNAYQCYFLSLSQHLSPPMTTCWLLQGVADGLMLLASREGRLGVVNPLTRQLRLLPDAKISSRLRLESCLKKKLWHHDQLPSISINIVVDSASKTFRVMVLGELRMKQVQRSNSHQIYSINQENDYIYSLIHKQRFPIKVDLLTAVEDTEEPLL